MLKEQTDNIKSIYELLFNSSNIIQVILDLETGLVHSLSNKACIFLGKTKEELINSSICTISNITKINDEIYNSLMEDNTIKIFSNNHYYDGKVKWINCKVDKLTLNDNTYLHIYEYENSQIGESFIKDFCDDYNFVTFVNLTNQFSKTLTDISLDPIVAIDMNSQIVYSNKAGEILTGLSKDEIIGTPFYDYIVDKVYIKKVFDEIIEKGYIENSEFEVINANGSYTPMVANTTRVDDNNGVPIGVISILRDNTLNLQKITQLEKAKKLAEETNNLKSDFISNISHELRTPINVIFSSLQLLELHVAKSKDEYEDTYNNITRCTKIMKQNSYRLIRLTNNLINISKLDAGVTNLNPTNIELVSFLKRLVYSVSSYIDNKQININFNSTIDTKIINIDIDKFEIIILNLLSNAIKFTHYNGNITLDIYEKDSNLIISIKDDGIGIPKDKLDSIFERFIQVDNILRRCNEGSGIGLSLVKSYIELHGGTIDVYSDLDVGTEFIISLPANTLKESNVYENSLPTNNNRFVQLLNIEFSDIYDIN